MSSFQSVLRGQGAFDHPKNTHLIFRTLFSDIYGFIFIDYRSSDHQQNVQQGLKEMKQQYLMTVEKIRGG